MKQDPEERKEQKEKEKQRREAKKSKRPLKEQQNDWLDLVSLFLYNGVYEQDYYALRIYPNFIYPIIRSTNKWRLHIAKNC